MTISQFIRMIGEAETSGIKDPIKRLDAVGDDGLAGGFYQMHWAWRQDNWPLFAWQTLRVLDALALEGYCRANRNLTARQLADKYNLGHLAPDPNYDERCRLGLMHLGIAMDEIDQTISDV